MTLPGLRGALSALALAAVACALEPVAEQGPKDAGAPPVPERAEIGAACKFNEDCATNECHGGLPDGACTRNDCGACPAGSACHALGEEDYCFKSCTPGECRPGYQCFEGVCLPSCSQDSDCGTGNECAGGACRKKQPVVTGTCTQDSQCPSRVCLVPEKQCSRECAASSDCGSDVCSIRDALDATGVVTSVRRVCLKAQPGAGVGGPCKAGKDCLSSFCHLGRCTEICTDGSCPGGLACVPSQHPLPFDKVVPVSVCLPPKETLVFSPDGLEPQFLTSIPVPGHTVSFSIVASAADARNLPVIVELRAPDRTPLYQTPRGQEDFYKQPIRHYPRNHVSTMLVPNTPSVALQRTGLYRYQTGVYNEGGQYVGRPNLRLFYKLAPGGAVSQGTLNLNFYVAGMGGHPCGNTDAASAPNDLKASIDTVRRIYAKAHVTLGKITFQNMTRPDLQRIDGQDEAALARLFQSSAGQTQPAINIFLVRSLSPQGLLGVAGGIPGPPLHGTSHSGVVATFEARCHQVLGNVIAHELGHYLGLFHNIEQDGHQDPIVDSTTSAQNLMYWNEQGGEELSSGQGYVMRNNAVVELSP
jgi:hypothetical protein